MIAADSEGSKSPYTLSKISTDLYIEVTFDKASTFNHPDEFNHFLAGSFFLHSRGNAHFISFAMANYSGAFQLPSLVANSLQSRKGQKQNDMPYQSTASILGSL